MDNEKGSLSFDALIQDSDFKKKIDEMEARIKGLGHTVDDSGNKIQSRFQSMAVGITSALSISAAMQFREKLIQVRGEFQKYEAVLANSLGSQSDAAASMKMLSDLASNTPFQLNTLTASYVKLVNQGFKPSREEIIKLGDLASSTGKGFDQLAEAVLDAQTGQFERLKEFGIKASKSGEQIAFSFKGVTQTVSDSGDAIRDYMLSLGDLDGVKGSMEAISKTLEGQVSNLEDSITSMFNEIGESSEGFLSGSISMTQYLVENYREVGNILGTLITAYGAYKAAVIAVTVVQKAHDAALIQSQTTGKAVTALQAVQVAGIKRLQAAQLAFNNSVLANPYVAVATAVIAVVTATYLVFRQKTIEVASALDVLSKAQNEVNKGMATEKAKIEPLVKTVQDLTVEENKRKAAYDKLKEINPALLEGITLQEAATSKLTQRVKEYLIQAEKKIAYDVYSGKLADAMTPQLEANDNLTELYKQQTEAVLRLNQAKKQFGENSVEAAREGGTVGGLTKQIQDNINSWKEAEVTISAIKDKMANYVPEVQETPKNEGGSITGTKNKDKDEFDKLIEYKKKVYKDYEDWKAAFGASEANKQFKALTEEATSFRDYLERSIHELEAKKDDLTKKEIQNLYSLKTAYAEVLVEQIKISQQKAYDARNTDVVNTLPGLEAITRERKRQADETSSYEVDSYAIAITKLAELGSQEISSFAALTKRKINLLKLQGKDVKALEEAYQKLIDKMNSEESKGATLSKIGQTFSDVSQILSTIGSISGDVNGEFSQMSQSASAIAGSVGNIASGLASGNIVQAAQGFLQLGDALDKAFGLQAKARRLDEERLEYNKALLSVIDGISSALERQLKLLESQPDSLRLTGSMDAYKKSIEDASKGLAKMKFDLATAPKGVKIELDLDKVKAITKLEDSKAALDKALDIGLITQEDYDLAVQYLNVVEEGQSEIDRKKKEYNQYLTTTTEDAITSSITDGFANGKSGIADFADTFEELMRNAMLHALQVKALDEPMKQWYADFATAMEDNELTPEERAALKAQWDNMIKAYTLQGEQMEQMTGVSLQNPGNSGSSLTGAIKGVTEETASLIGGQMNAIRMNQAQSMEMVRSQLFHLANISSNTYKLHRIEEEIILLNSKISKPGLSAEAF